MVKPVCIPTQERGNEENKKRLVPELRFPEFRDVGEWVESNLGFVLTSVSNGLSIEQANVDTGYKVTRIETISDRKIDSNKVGYIQTDQDISSYKLSVGDILFSNINSISHIGKAVIVDQDYDLYHGMNLLRLVVNKENNVPHFIYYLIITPRIKASFEARANKAVNQASINQTELRNTILATPPLKDEQQKIADCLSSLDELITAHTQKHQALQSYKKGLMQNLFPAEGETVPALRFPEFRDAGDWEKKELEELATYTKGFAFKSKDYTDKGVRIIRVSDLGADFIKSNNERIFINSESVNDYKRYEIKNSEIIITTVGSKPEMIDSAVGRGIYVSTSKAGLLNQNLLKLEVNVKINSRFLYSNINTKEYQSFIASISRGNANQANIAVKELMKFQIKIPKYEEQQKIADCLSSIDELIATQAQKIEALKAHKKGLMQQLFPVMDDDCMDVGGRATQDAKAEVTA